MRRKIFAANWKMNLTPLRARALIAALRADLDRDAAVLARDREVVIAPPFVAIPAVAQALAGSTIELGAQNMHFEDSGAFTGEVSAPMLKECGVRHVILGHSERRRLFGETDSLVNQKLKAALKHGLTPIVCIGETLEQREAGETDDFVAGQVRAAFLNVPAEKAERCVVAYEPIWAIGTGLTADVAQVHSMMTHVRSVLATLGLGDTRVLYGGSVNAENAASLVAEGRADGFLVGGASLKAESFLAIIQACDDCYALKR